MTTWMLLEDEPDLYDMILAMYEIMGIGGVAFGTGEDAWDWIREVDYGLYEEELPELALLDIRMPDSVTGPMVAHFLRESQQMSDIVIVMMTAYQLTPSEEAELMDITQADYLLYKPLPGLVGLHRLLHDLVTEKRAGNKR